MTSSRESDSWSPNFGSAADAYPPAVVAARVARPGLILFVAFLTELLVIAGAANQSVSNTIAHNLGGHTKDLSANMGLALLTFRWRFVPLAHDTAHVWTGELALIGVVFAGTALVLLPLVRGAVSFLRAFIGTWLAVIVATEGGWTVRGLIVSFSGHLAGSGNRGNQAIFGAQQTTGYVLVGGAELGLVAAIVAAIVAVASRRSPVVAPPVLELAPEGTSYTDPAAGGVYPAYQPADGPAMPPQAFEPPQPPYQPPPPYQPQPPYDAPATQAFEPPPPVPPYTPPPAYDAPTTQVYEPPPPTPATEPPTGAPATEPPAPSYPPPAEDVAPAHAYDPAPAEPEPSYEPPPSYQPPPSYDAPSTQMYQPPPASDDPAPTQTFEPPPATDYPAAPAPPMERDTSDYSDTAHLPDPGAAASPDNDR